MRFLFFELWMKIHRKSEMIHRISKINNVLTAEKKVTLATNDQQSLPNVEIIIDWTLFVAHRKIITQKK